LPLPEGPAGAGAMGRCQRPSGGAESRLSGSNR